MTADQALTRRHAIAAADHSQSAVMGTPLLVAFFARVQRDEVQRRLEGARKA